MNVTKKIFEYINAGEFLAAGELIKKTEIDFKQTQDDMSLTMTAIARGARSIVKKLIEMDPNIEFENKDGYTAMDYCEDVRIFEALLRKSKHFKRFAIVAAFIRVLKTDASDLYLLDAFNILRTLIEPEDIAHILPEVDKNLRPFTYYEMLG